MSLMDAKLLLGLSETTEADPILEWIFNRVEKALLIRTKLTEVPEALDYVVTEVAIVRYNRRDAEGMKNVSDEGFSATYSDDIFSEYAKDISEYLESLDSDPATVGKVRFL